MISRRNPSCTWHVIVALAGVCSPLSAAAQVAPSPSGTIESAFIQPREIFTLFAPYDSIVEALRPVGHTAVPMPQLPPAVFVGPPRFPDLLTQHQSARALAEAHSVARLADTSQDAFAIGARARIQEARGALSAFQVPTSVEPTSPWVRHRYTQPARAAFFESLHTLFENRPQRLSFRSDAEISEWVTRIRSARQMGSPDALSTDDRGALMLARTISNIAINDQEAIGLLEEYALFYIRQTEFARQRFFVRKHYSIGDLVPPNSQSLILNLPEFGPLEPVGQVVFFTPRSHFSVVAPFSFSPNPGLPQASVVMPQPVVEDAQLRRFAEYWRWVRQLTILDADDRQFLNELRTRRSAAAIAQQSPAPPSLNDEQLMDALIAEAERARDAILRVAAITALAFDVMSVPANLPATIDAALPLLKARFEQVKALPAWAIFSSAPPTDAEYFTVAVGMSYASALHARQAMSPAARAWFPGQLRPPVIYRGTWISTIEEYPLFSIAQNPNFPPYILPLYLQSNPVVSRPFFNQLLPFESATQDIFSREANRQDLIGQNPNSPRRILQGIIDRQAAAISPTLHSAGQFLRGDDLYSAWFTVNASVIATAQDLRRAGSAIRAAADGLEDALFTAIAGRRFGHVVVPEDAIVVGHLVSVGSVARRGDPVLAVRPVHRVTASGTVLADASTSAWLFPGAVGQASVVCPPGPVPMGAQVRQALNASPNQPVLTNALVQISALALSNARFRATVFRAEQIGGLDEPRRFRISVELEAPAASRTVTIPASTLQVSASALSAIGFRARSNGELIEVDLSAGLLEIGSTCRVNMH